MKFNILYLFTLVTLFSACQNQETKLPILGQRSPVEVKDAQGNVKVDTVYSTIPNFGFINQDSVLLTQAHFDGKIYIADFFFTSCTTICPVMHRNMKSIYDQYKDDDHIQFLSHSIDFKYDTPSKLKKYAEKLGVNTQKWAFVRGTKDSIYNMALKHYLVAVGEDQKAKDGYIHEGYLILVDKEKRIRGAYDGTDSKSVEKLKNDIAVLEKEEFGDHAK